MINSKRIMIFLMIIALLCCVNIVNATTNDTMNNIMSEMDSDQMSIMILSNIY